MEQTIDEKRKQIIEKIIKIKKISFEKAKELLTSLETYCELIINYTLKETDEQH
jgi:hypothetical protein